MYTLESLRTQEILCPNVLNQSCSHHVANQSAEEEDGATLSNILPLATLSLSISILEDQNGGQ